MSFTVDDKKLMRALKELPKRVENRTVKRAIVAGAKITANAIKRQLPQRWKDGKKAIGYSYKKPRSGMYKGITFAKAGANVGMTKKKREKRQLKRLGSTRSRKGVGISEANIHWFLAGTAERMTGRKTRRRKGAAVSFRDTGGTKRRTGKMKKSMIVQKAYAQSHSAALAVIKGTLAKELFQELGHL